MTIKGCLHRSLEVNTATGKYLCPICGVDLGPEKGKAWLQAGRGGYKRVHCSGPGCMNPIVVPWAFQGHVYCGEPCLAEAGLAPPTRQEAPGAPQTAPGVPGQGGSPENAS